MARNTPIRLFRGTKARLDALAAQGSLTEGEPFFITDQNRIGVATSQTTYEVYAKLSEAGGGGDVLLASNNLSDLDNSTTARNNLGLGTSATATVTTSSFDTTTGRVTKVSDFGIGNIQSSVITGDWNNFPETYPGNGIVGVIQIGQANAPDINYHILEQRFFNAQVLQIAWPYRVDADIFLKVRSRFSGTWTAWKTIYSETMFIYAQNQSGASVASNNTVAGSALNPANSGTWRNVSGNNIENNGYGLWLLI